MKTKSDLISFIDAVNSETFFHDNPRKLPKQCLAGFKAFTNGWIYHFVSRNQRFDEYAAT